MWMSSTGADILCRSAPPVNRPLVVLLRCGALAFAASTVALTRRVVNALARDMFAMLSCLVYDHKRLL